jgi:hypothetical protein
MVHGMNRNPHRAIVLPKSEALASDLRDALQRLGIELLRFELDQEMATIRR